MVNTFRAAAPFAALVPWESLDLRVLREGAFLATEGTRGNEKPPDSQAPKRKRENNRLTNLRGAARELPY